MKKLELKKDLIVTLTKDILGQIQGGWVDSIDSCGDSTGACVGTDYDCDGRPDTHDCDYTGDGDNETNMIDCGSLDGGCDGGGGYVSDDGGCDGDGR